MGECYVNPHWQEDGMAIVIITRVRPSGNLVVGNYLVDTQCLGVKDCSYFHNHTPYEFSEFLNNMREEVDMEKVDYVLAHNIIYGAIDFAEEGGIEPAPDFNVAEFILEEDTEEIPLIHIDFGDEEGRHHLMIGPTGKERFYIQRLRKTLGEDFVYTDILESDDFDYEDYADDEEWVDDYRRSAIDDEIEEYVRSLSPEERQELLKHSEKILEGIERTRKERARHPQEEYSYVYPEYPKTLTLHNLELVDILLNGEELFLPDREIKKLLASDPILLTQDLCNIIIYCISHTHGRKLTHPEDAKYSNALINSLGLLMELKNPDALPAILELFRQDSKFQNFHFGDFAIDIVGGAMIACGRNHLDEIEKLFYEKGLDSDWRNTIIESLEVLGNKHPEYKETVKEMFRRYLCYMYSRVAAADGCDAGLAGFLIGSITNLQDREALPLIRKFFKEDLVDLSMVEEDEVEEDMNDDYYDPRPYPITESLSELYAKLRDPYKPYVK